MLLDEHQPRGAGPVRGRVGGVDALGTQLAKDELAEGVAAHAARPGDAVAEPGEADGDVGLRPREAVVCRPPWTSGPSPEGHHRLTEGHDVDEARAALMGNRSATAR